jgi:outer membrane protein OmpA-like peptidoglycan-associated protein
VNDYGKPQNDTAQQDERAHELIEQLNLLEAVDRRVTPEHVARRFHELLGSVGPSAPADVNRQALREPGIQRARRRRLSKVLRRVPDARLRHQQLRRSRSAPWRRPGRLPGRITAAGHQRAAADRLIDAGRAVHQGVGPLSDSAVDPNSQDSVVGYRRTDATPEADERPLRLKLPDTKPVSLRRWLTSVAVPAAAAVIAIAVAIAAAVLSVRFASTSSLENTNVVIAATATANEPAPVLSAGISQILQSAGVTSSRANAYVVNPVTGRPTEISLTPHRTSGQVDYGPNRSQILAADITAVQQTLEKEAASGPLDVLAAIATATRAVSSPGTLIVLSSGLSTAGGFDLRQIGWDASPSSVVAELKAAELLPDLAGWRVVFSGLGDTAGRQPALPSPLQATLTSYWEAICRASGAASCSTDDTARPQLASHVTTLAPIVPVPVVTAEKGPGGRLITSLPDTLLFSFDSSALVPSADTILQPLAQRARGEHLLVSIIGYASPDGGTSAYNLALSKRRANAVRNRLIALGLPTGQITKVTGAGTAGQSASGCLIHSHIDEAICAQLRRVVVILSPAKANP